MEFDRKPTALAKRTLENISDHMLHNCKRRKTSSGLADTMFSAAKEWDNRASPMLATWRNGQDFIRPLMDECAVDAEDGTHPWHVIRGKMRKLNKKKEMPKLRKNYLTSLFELAAWWLHHFCEKDETLSRESVKYLDEKDGWCSLNKTTELRRANVELINKYASMIAVIALMVERGDEDGEASKEILKALEDAKLDHAQLQRICQVIDIDAKTKRTTRKNAANGDVYLAYEYCTETPIRKVREGDHGSIYLSYEHVYVPNTKERMQHEAEFWKWFAMACAKMTRKVAYNQEAFEQIRAFIERICFQKDHAITSMLAIMEWKFKTDF